MGRIIDVRDIGKLAKCSSMFFKAAELPYNVEIVELESNKYAFVNLTNNKVLVTFTSISKIYDDKRYLISVNSDFYAFVHLTEFNLHCSDLFVKVHTYVCIDGTIHAIVENINGLKKLIKWDKNGYTVSQNYPCLAMRDDNTKILISSSLDVFELDIKSDVNILSKEYAAIRQNDKESIVRLSDFSIAEFKK